MPRFSLKQLLFGFAALALMLSVYRLANYRRLVPLKNEISRIEFSPDGRQIAFRHYASNDAGVAGKLYQADISSFVGIADVATLESWQTVHHDFAAGNQGPAFGWRWRHYFSYSADGKFLDVWKEMQGGPEAWDVQAKKWIGTQNPLRSSSAGFRRSPDGRWTTTSNRQWEVVLTDTASSNSNQLITLWKSVHGFSRDSKRIVVSTNKAVEVWQLEPRELVGRFHLPVEPLNRVTLVELSPDGDTLAIRCNDGLRVYSLSTSQERIILPEYFVAIHYPNGGWGTRGGSGDSTRGVEFTPDGKVMVAWGDYGLKFLDMENQAKEFQSVPAVRQMYRATENMTFGAAFLSDGRVMLSWGQYGLKFFDMDRRAKEFRSVATPHVRCLAFAPDEKTFATGDCEGRLILWNTSDGKRLRSVRFRGRARPVLINEYGPATRTRC